MVWIWGAVLDIKRRKRISPSKNFGEILIEYHNENGWDMFHIPFFNRNIIFCADLEAASKILGDPKTFTRTKTAHKCCNSIGGTRCWGEYGILTEPGTHVWSTTRRLMEPAFRKAFLRTTMEGINQVAERLVSRLFKKQDTICDISNEFNKSAFEAIASCGFAWSQDKIENESTNQLEMAEVMMKTIFLNLQDLFFNLPWMYKEEKDKFRKAITGARISIHKHLEDRIANCESAPIDDILSYIIRANTFSDQFTIENIVDDYLVFLAAGMETTSITLACVVFVLQRNREVYTRVQEEIDTVFTNKDELEFEDLPKLSYLEAVIKETLRMHPPVTSTFRMCSKNGIILSGMPIPKDAAICLMPVLHHYNPAYWEDPETFIPDRFTGLSRHKIKPFTFLPFMAGPRNCIGKNFAMLEMKVVLAKLLKEFELVNPDPTVTKLVMASTSLTARPVDPIRVTLLPRN